MLRFSHFFKSVLHFPNSHSEIRDLWCLKLQLILGSPNLVMSNPDTAGKQWIFDLFHWDGCFQGKEAVTLSVSKHLFTIPIQPAQWLSQSFKKTINPNYSGQPSYSDHLDQELSPENPRRKLIVITLRSDISVKHEEIVNLTLWATRLMEKEKFCVAPPRIESWMVFCYGYALKAERTHICTFMFFDPSFFLFLLLLLRRSWTSKHRDW